MRIRWLAFVVLFLSSCATVPDKSLQPVTAEPLLVLRNGKIFTGAEGENAWLDAIGIRGGRVVLAGKNGGLDRALPQLDGEKRIIDLEGRTVVPGFNDAHMHVSPLPDHVPLVWEGLDPSFETVITTIRTAAASAPESKWLVGTIGPAVLFDERTTRDALDEASNGRPLALTTWSGHASLFNSRALELLGVRDSVVDPFGGTWRRDSAGRLTGRADEYAAYAQMRALASLATPQQKIDAYRAVSDEALRFGITSLQLMAIAESARQTGENLLASGSPVRWRVIPFVIPHFADLGLDSELTLKNDLAPNVTISGAKWILDGTPVEGGAAMSGRYAAATKFPGELNFSPVQIRSMVENALRREQQPMFHAVGNRAVQSVIDALDATGGTVQWRDRRVRIEHGDFITPEQARSLARLGVVVVQNPTHFTVGDIIATRYGPGVLKSAQPFQSLHESGVMIAVGSDGPMNPGLNVLFATTRYEGASEALSRETAVRAYTWGSAYAEHAEEAKGLLLPGGVADLAVLSDDIFTVPHDQLPRIVSVLTMISGKIVYDAGALKSTR